MSSIALKKKPTSVTVPSAHEGFLRAQRLSYEAVISVGREMQEGWTEQQTADLIGTYLKDCGVKAFFHEPYAWFGDRSRFDGINRKKYSQFNPTHRRLQVGDAVILDVAPILKGYVGDIGYSLSLGTNAALEKAQGFLRRLRRDIPNIFTAHPNHGGDVWRIIDRQIREAGYDNIHTIYPFHVLGHRVAKTPFSEWALRTPLRFSLHSFWQILSHGFLSELLNANHRGSLNGLWAIEPHIGWDGAGAKFEEILVVDENGARWLDDEVPHK